MAHRILAGVAATALVALFPTAAQAEESDPSVVLPVISAGGPYYGVVDVAVDIEGSLPEIAVPVGAAVAFDDTEILTVWEYDGPGDCEIGNVNALATTITCDTAGEYGLTLTASPHLESSLSDTTLLEIKDNEDEEPPANTPPTNDAAGAYEGNENEPIALEGSASDVDGDALTHKWTITSGPGTCYFSDDTKLDSTITCDTHGYYHLLLTTTDGKATVTDTAAMKIWCETEPVPTTPAPSPTKPAEEPTPSTPSTSTTPSLPVTGSSLSSVLTSGVVLVGLGVAALVFGRVRRTRTES
jgi:hypothetical protein